MDAEASGPSRPALSVIQHVIPLQVLVYTVVAYAPRSTALRLSAFGAIALLTFRALRCTTGDIPQDYGMGCFMGAQLIVVFAFTVLNYPLDNFRNEKDVRPPQEMPFLRRIWWAICIMHSARGIGWNTQARHTPPRPTSTRLSFLVTRLFHCLLYCILFDLITSYGFYNPVFFDLFPKRRSITSQGPLMTALNCLVFACGGFTTLSLQYEMLAVCSVALGLTEVRDWPKLFGSVMEAYTLRNFWGRVWHQLLQRSLSTMGKSLARLFNLPRGSLLYGIVYLYTAFAISALIHSIGDFAIDHSSFGRSAAFFSIQAVGITMESLVIALVRKPASSFIARCIGYVWVGTWLTITAPWLIDTLFDGGLFYAFPVSPTRALISALEARLGFSVKGLFPVAV